MRWKRADRANRDYLKGESLNLQKYYFSSFLNFLFSCFILIVLPHFNVFFPPTLPFKVKNHFVHVLFCPHRDQMFIVTSLWCTGFFCRCCWSLQADCTVTNPVSWPSSVLCFIIVDSPRYWPHVFLTLSVVLQMILPWKHWMLLQLYCGSIIFFCYALVNSTQWRKHHFSLFNWMSFSFFFL